MEDLCSIFPIILTYPCCVSKRMSKGLCSQFENITQHYSLYLLLLWLEEDLPTIANLFIIKKLMFWGAKVRCGPSAGTHSYAVIPENGRGIVASVGEPSLSCSQTHLASAPWFIALWHWGVYSANIDVRILY